YAIPLPYDEGGLGRLQHAFVVLDRQRVPVPRHHPVGPRIGAELRLVSDGVARDVDVPAVVGGEVVAGGVQQVAMEQHAGAGATGDGDRLGRGLEDLDH